jgi:hypothetical protein
MGSLYIYINVKFRFLFTDLGKVEKILRVELPFPAPQWEHTFMRDRGIVLRASTWNQWTDKEVLSAKLPE